MLENMDWQATGTWLAALVAVVGAIYAGVQARAARKTAKAAETQATAATTTAKAAETQATAATKTAKAAEMQATAATKTAKATEELVRTANRQADVDQQRAAEDKRASQAAALCDIEDELAPFMRPPYSGREWLLAHDSAYIMDNFSSNPHDTEIREYLDCLNKLARLVNQGMVDEQAVLHRWGEDIKNIWTRHGSVLIVSWRRKYPYLCIELGKLAEQWG